MANNTTNNNNNTNNMSKEQKAQKSAQFQAERLQKASEKFEAAKNYEAKATGAISEIIRKKNAETISGMNYEGLITACVARAKELAKVTGVDKDLVRYLKKDVADAVRANIEAEKLALYVDCARAMYKVDMAIKYACAASRNEDVKKILKAMKKASK